MMFDTIEEAAEAWMSEFNRFPESMIEQLIKDNPDDWTEITPPTECDTVYIYNGEYRNQEGEIKRISEEGDYIIELDSGEEIECDEDDFEVLYYGGLPMWGWMWQFDDSVDDWWLETKGGLQAMADCGFRIYESGEYGYFFGIDGAGYDFLQQHWIPLYKARGLLWDKQSVDAMNAEKAE